MACQPMPWTPRFCSVFRDCVVRPGDTSQKSNRAEVEIALALTVGDEDQERPSTKSFPLLPVLKY